MRKPGILLVCVFFILPLYAENAIPKYTYTRLVETIRDVKQPVIQGKYILFTAKPQARHVGIAFEHQEFKEVHSFERLSTIDFESGEKKEILFYIMPLPEKTTLLRYRLVIDGLWTTDPLNPNEEYDMPSGLSFSLISLPSSAEYKTAVSARGHVRFIHRGEAGKYITIAGSFNRWDPFMYEFKEIRPGFYELELPLPKGTWTYAYFTDGKQIPDSTNNNHVYTGDGRTASVITID